MAKKPTGSSRTGGRKRAGASRGGAKRAAGARKAAPKKGARKTARKAASKSAAPGKRSGAAKKTAGRGPRGARRSPSRGATRARKTTSRGRRPAGAQVSRSTSRAKWIESPDDRADRAGQTLATRNHDVIRQWAEERGATPATTPGGDPADPRVLRFNFPGFGGQSLQEIDWEDFFRTFDDRNLVFLFQDRMKAGNQSNFFRFDNPDREDA